MPMNLSGKSLLTLLDFSAEEIGYLLDLAASFKTMKYAGVPHRYLEGKNIVLLFEKTSTRTRCAFEVGAMDLGMGVTYLDPGSSQMGKKESIEDTARVLGRMYDGIEYRGFEQSVVEELAANAGVPVWNGLTAQFHPTQALADILTMREEFGQDLKGRKMAFFGQVGNTASSLLVICAKLGIDFVQVGPQSDAPGNRTYSPDLWRVCQQLAAESGATLSVTDSVDEGVRGVDAVYTDVWVGLGQSADLWKDRIALLEPYRVTESVMARANADAIFMHCLPSFHDTNTTIGADIAKQFGVREMEVEDAVFESKRSRVFQEAENRMHTIKAVMYATLR
ncbi:ornithine carbamoyltransferase [Rubneribacter badeniensis]|uniref:Ornithine carbamoyltransferase n=3 Tax=Rubneribacter badeniensis TaxID=2070688 RepID=A0A2K2U6P4_9ACTN|nr:ornithine carbamoyltransferase [Rubneribacter badeniensis]OUO96569.1 ornithine carbamoyltransferase [Gordonibacter sp. An232A]PNV65850.1 ornithine carbamoyltransferase [Rubneribacter badeniensis]